jgi:hypothetical protein
MIRCHVMYILFVLQVSSEEHDNNDVHVKMLCEHKSFHISKHAYCGSEKKSQQFCKP